MHPVLVIGSSGQLASALRRRARPDTPLMFFGRQVADLADQAALHCLFAAWRPRLLINAGAYTAVDRAESEPEIAFALNRDGPHRLAMLCKDHDCSLVQVSTDYVFDGTERRPYRECDPVSPLGVYGASKAAGERAVRETLPQHVILRTAWVYGPDGHNFLKTIMRLAGERSELAIVDDQHGTPTFADDLADVVLSLTPAIAAETVEWGTYHIAGRGETTWFGFAAEILQFMRDRGLCVPKLRAITSAEYLTAARRPPYSVLDTRKIERLLNTVLPHWTVSLRACLEKMHLTTPALMQP